MSISKAYKEAHKYFGLVPGDGLVLHHKDPTLRHTNRKRYDEWRPEDLVVMSLEEHSSLHHKGKKLSEVHKKRIGEAHRGKKRPPVSEETREKLSTAHKGQIPWIKGKKHTEEVRKRISEKCKGKNTIPVAQYDLNGELVKIWESAIKAEKEGGFNNGNIGAVCRGKRPHHKGYVWRYA